MAMHRQKEHEGRMTDILAENISDELSRMAQRLESFDFSPVWNEMLDPLHEGFSSNFDQTRGPDGIWPPHAPYTILLHGPHPLLILTGAMKRSVTQSGSEGRIEELMRNEAKIGTSFFYAPYQQFGTRKIPARPFLWLEGSYVERLTNQLADAMMARVFNGNGTG
jgi:phage gpG-like protein